MLNTSRLREPVACVDLETTGGSASQHRIIEVGIVILEGGRPVEEWSQLVNPLTRIPSSIEQFTGISNEMVADAPTFDDLRNEIRRRLDGRLFVAHNARFDYGFLRSEFRRMGERFSAKVLCTVRLSRTLFPDAGRHNLDTLIERYGLSCDARHRALGDARVLPALLAAMESAVGVEQFAERVEAVMHEAKLPSQLNPDLLDDLPEAPGVYLFRGEGGTLLYVGKSRNIRSRVMSHFSAEHRSDKEAMLAKQVRDVEWIETAGELGALLREAQLVKSLAPMANRRLRDPRAVHCLRLEETADHLRAVIEPLDMSTVGGVSELYGPFRSEKDALKALDGKAREAALCRKRLGLEKGEGSCFGYQLGRCRGVCVGKELPQLHDMRVKLALASLKIRAWPFAGPIAVREGGVATSAEIHVLDRWQHLGSVTEGEDPTSLVDVDVLRSFDADSYRIIARFLREADPRDIVVLGKKGH